MLLNWYFRQRLRPTINVCTSFVLGETVIVSFHIAWCPKNCSYNCSMISFAYVLEMERFSASPNGLSIKDPKLHSFGLYGHVFCYRIFHINKPLPWPVETGEWRKGTTEGENMIWKTRGEAGGRSRKKRIRGEAEHEIKQRDKKARGITAWRRAENTNVWECIFLKRLGICC